MSPSPRADPIGVGRARLRWPLLGMLLINLLLWAAIIWAVLAVMR